ncbi:MAG: sulfotransferase [Phycisphaerales bacterium]
MSSIATAMQQLSPVFITAPTARNGVTLIQRLFNSSRRIAVYGENLILMDRLPMLVHTTVFQHKACAEEIRDSRRKFLEETTEYWSSNLGPDTEESMLLMFDSFYRHVKMYDDTARRDGFDRWGVKHPMSNVHMIERLRTLLPKSRFVFIYRNLFEVAASAKARQFIKSAADMRNYAVMWQTNLLRVLDEKAPDTLILRHDELVADPADAVARIEAFTGVTGIDQSVTQRKINTFDSNLPGRASGSYVAPMPLNDEETDILRRFAADALARTGYEHSHLVA